MQEHHIQRELLHKLVLSNGARFSELRPKHIDSNVITYHLKQLMAEKLVIKNEHGVYELTALGRVAGINITMTRKELLQQAHSVLLMVLRDGDKWLLRKRLAQPMYEKVGFVHDEPIYSKSVLDQATDTFEARTGLRADFKQLGSGYIRLIRDNELESFIGFSLFYAETYTGTLQAHIRNGENAWYDNPDFTAPEMIPSMSDLATLIDKKQPFFFDKTYDISG